MTEKDALYLFGLFCDKTRCRRLFCYCGEIIRIAEQELWIERTYD